MNDTSEFYRRMTESNVVPATPDEFDSLKDVLSAADELGLIEWANHPRQKLTAQQRRNLEFLRHEVEVGRLQS